MSDHDRRGIAVARFACQHGRWCGLTGIERPPGAWMTWMVVDGDWLWITAEHEPRFWGVQ